MKKKIIVISLILISAFCFTQGQINESLIKAVKKNDLNLIKQLLEKGADINTRDNMGHTPLMIAARNGNYHTVKFLLTKKPDVNARNKRGANALFLTNGVDNYKIVGLLKEAGSDSLSVGERIQSGGGWYLTGFGLGVVFLGLTLLFLFMAIAMKVFASVRERENRKEILWKISKLAMRRATVDIPYGAENTADVNDEVVAAIGLALNLYFTMYETQDEMARLTQIIKINPISPWKLYHRSNTLHRNENRFTR